MNYRAAVIGCGKIGSEFGQDSGGAGARSHAQAYAVCGETTLATVCDLDPAKAQACAKYWGAAAWYVDAQQLLTEQQPQIVSICTPDGTHAAMARQVLEHRSVLALLLEKPLALSLREGRDLVALAKDRGVILAVNYSRRFATSHRRLVTFIQSGALGRIQTVGGIYTKGLLHNGTHWFDLARLLVGEVTAVRGFDSLREKGDDPTLDARLEFSGGATGYLHACSNESFTVFECDVIGTKGRVRLVESGQTFETYAVGDSPLYSGYRTLARSQALDGGLEDALSEAVADLVGSLKERRQPRCSGEDGLAALRIALAVRESETTGQRVAVDSL